ncbi:hypothetical protein ACH4UM_39890, partial [Streptomyces sp. NPDC020801]
MLAATVCASSLVTIGASGASATPQQTAWSNGAFHVDVPNVVRSSDIALTHPNANANQALP